MKTTLLALSMAAAAVSPAMADSGREYSRVFTPFEKTVFYDGYNGTVFDKDVQDGILRHEIESPSAPAEKIERVRKVYTALDLPARCHELIDTYVDEAIASLDHAGLTPAARDFFAAIADKSRTRTH